MSTAPLYRVVEACRLCGSRDIEPCIDLGSQYLASAFVPTNDGLPLDSLRAPLSVVLCRECGLLQLGQTVQRPALFAEYHYRSGTNPMMRGALRDFAQDSARSAGLRAGDAVLDTGCNDGTMLTFFPSNCRRFGIDPAANISWDGLPADITVRRGYFDASTVRAMAGDQPFRLVTSVAMLYSVEDLSSFARDVRSILAEDGTWSIQVSYLPSIAASLSFYDICHEHIYYFTLATLSRALERSGFRIIDASLNDVNGGSLRVHAVHAARGVEPSDAVTKLRAAERVGGWEDSETYQRFMDRVHAMKAAVCGVLEDARATGRPPIGLGASTKGNVLLQYFGIDRELMPYISERNPEKVGLRTLGTDIELISEARARELNPSVMLVLIWFFRDELLKRERGYLEQGGELLFPMPYPHLVTAQGTQVIEWEDPAGAREAV